MKEYLLTAGPTPVPERVLLAMAAPIRYHVGYFSELDIIAAASGLETTSSDLGYGVKPGSGVAAAQASFAQTRRPTS